MILKSKWKRLRTVSLIMKVLQHLLLYVKLRLIMGDAHHDIIPRLLPLQVLVLQLQLGNVGLVMGRRLQNKRASDTQNFQWDFNRTFHGISNGNHLLVRMMRSLQLILHLRDPALHVIHLCN